MKTFRVRGKLARQSLTIPFIPGYLGPRSSKSIGKGSGWNEDTGVDGMRTLELDGMRTLELINEETGVDE